MGIDNPDAFAIACAASGDTAGAGSCRCGDVAEEMCWGDVLAAAWAARASGDTTGLGSVIGSALGKLAVNLRDRGHSRPAASTVVTFPAAYSNTSGLE